MSVKEFFQKYNGKGIDYDGYYGFQCVDLYRQYVKECLEYPQSQGVKGAADIWESYLKDYYERINNDPDAIPAMGDIIIWNKNAGGGYGHVSIFSFGDVDSFVSFDQNWPIGSLCHFQNHNYTNVQGWLRPNKLKETPPLEINDQTKLPLGEPWGNPELQAVRSILTAQKKKIEELTIRLEDVKASCEIDIERLTREYEEKLKDKEPMFTNPIAKLFFEIAKALEK